MNALALSLEGGQVASMFLVLMRCTGLVIAAPIFGHRSIPSPVKAGFVAILALALSRTASVAPGAMPAAIAAPIELLIGLALGFILSLGFHAVELSGRLLALQMGLSLGAVFSPTQSEAGTALDPFFSVFAGLMFLAMNLHLAIVGVLSRSFVSLPIGGGWPSDLFLLAGNMTALALELGTRVAMPVALVLLLAELAVALVSRAIPQVNVFFLGLPIKILLGIAVTALAMPSLAAGAAQIYRFIFASAGAGALP